MAFQRGYIPDRGDIYLKLRWEVRQLIFVFTCMQYGVLEMDH
jgi:hypothetical protein